MTKTKWVSFLAAAGIPALILLFTLQGGDEIPDGVGLSLLNMTEVQKDSVVSNEIKNAKIGNEIISMRTETAKITKQEGNQFRAMISTVPQHYLDKETNTYKDIDLTVYEASAEAKLDEERLFDKYVNAGNYKATWFDSNPWDYTFYKDDYYVTYTAQFDTTNIEIITERRTDRIKQSIILLNDNADTTLKWLLDSNAFYSESNGEITFKDSSDNFLFRISSPIAWDSDRKTIDVDVSLVSDTLRYTAHVPIDAVYPVTVDPNTTIEAISEYNGQYNLNATYLTSRNNQTASNQDFFLVGQALGFIIRRSFTTFPGLPAIATVSACSLYLEGNSNSSTTDFEIYIFTSTYQAPGTASGDFDSFDGWETSGTYTGTILNEVWNTSSYSVAWNFIEFNADGRTAVKNASNDSLVIALISKEDFYASEPTNNEFVQFNSHGSGTDPYISFTYVAGLVPPSNFAIADSATTTLSYTWTDGATGEDGYFIKNLADTVTVGSYAADATSGTVTGLTPATSYSFFVVAYDTNGESGHSGTVTHDTQFAYNYTYTDSISITNFIRSRSTENASYSTARNTVDPAFIQSATVDTLGQIKDAGNDFHLYRNSIAAAIPAWSDSFITAILRINLVADASDTDFNLQVFQGTWTDGVYHDRHFDDFDGRRGALTPHVGTRLNDPWSTASFSGGILDLDFNIDGLNALETISQGSDSLQLVIISSRDSSATEPTADEYITLNDTNARLVYTWQRLNVVPQGMVLTPLTTTTIRASWRDETADEDSISLIRSSDDSVYISVVADDTTVVATGLAINEYNTFKLKVIGGSLDGQKTAADSNWTLAAKPGKVTVSYPSTSEIKIILDISSNPAYTKIAIQDSISSWYVHRLGSGVDDTLRVAVDWNTYASWGSADGCTLSVTPGDLLRLRSKARNTNQ
ncbi:MAG TPA: fibronectin type III domain-containing protein [bacterium]|nr:fibronectin type III domain-containing protein [bacterium]